MFRGQFLHSIDAKGRVSLPARFRDGVAPNGTGPFVVTPALFEPCLRLYPMAAWEALEEKVSTLSTLDPHTVRFRRMFISAAIECELDRAGRVLVPPHLRQKAELTKDVLWAGMGQFIEVWSKPLWDDALVMTPDTETAFKVAVTEHISI
jgi:MraZ protein